MRVVAWARGHSGVFVFRRLCGGGKPRDADDSTRKKKNQIDDDADSY